MTVEHFEHFSTTTVFPLPIHEQKTQVRQDRDTQDFKEVSTHVLYEWRDIHQV
jgi:hypothetical protein